MEKDVVAEATLNGKTLKIYYDDSPHNPREDDNLTQMVCFHKRYDLGDSDHDYSQKDFDSWSTLSKSICFNEKPLVIQPLYLYDHSGITISTGAFSCPWDSGKVGFIFITNKRIDELGTTINDGETYSQYKERLLKYLEGELETYDQYICGDVYGFKLFDEEDNELDSCWGFFGTDWKTNGIADHVDDEELVALL